MEFCLKMNVTMKNSISHIYNNFTRGHQKKLIFDFIRSEGFCNSKRLVMIEINSYYLGPK